MHQSNLDATGKLVLRLTIGILLLLHGIFKLRYGVDGIEGMLAAKGFPAFFAWGAYAGEVLAPVLVILGIYTRIGGLLIVVFMLAAITLAHVGAGHLTVLNDRSGGWALELQALYLFGGLVIALLGAGRFSLGGAQQRWN